MLYLSSQQSDVMIIQMYLSYLCIPFKTEYLTTDVVHPKWHWQKIFAIFYASFSR